MSKHETFRLPGLVDIHVHLRDPGQTHKEDFLSGTSAALSGGFTDVFDMPNNAVPIFTAAALEDKIHSAERQTVCDIGFYFGSDGSNLDKFDQIKSKVNGLKLYLNKTTGNYVLGAEHLTKIFQAWDSPNPILVHAEADVIADVITAVADTGQAAHVCHVSCRAELEPILAAKSSGLPVTCGVTPHHLFLNDQDTERLGVYGGVKPNLKPQADQDFLWEHFNQIDVVESDHAPHTREEKETGQAPYGMPGLETTLPLLLQAEREGKLTLADIVDKCATRPRQILRLEADASTYIDVEAVGFEISAKGLKTKAGWTPFEGRTGFGRVVGVTIRGTEVYRNGRVLARPGSGRIIYHPTDELVTL